MSKTETEVQAPAHANQDSLEREAAANALRLEMAMTLELSEWASYRDPKDSNHAAVKQKVEEMVNERLEAQAEKAAVDRNEKLDTGALKLHRLRQTERFRPSRAQRKYPVAETRKQYNRLLKLGKPFLYKDRLVRGTTSGKAVLSGNFEAGLFEKGTCFGDKVEKLEKKYEARNGIESEPTTEEESEVEDSAGSASEDEFDLREFLEEHDFSKTQITAAIKKANKSGYGRKRRIRLADRLIDKQRTKLDKKHFAKNDGNGDCDLKVGDQAWWLVDDVWHPVTITEDRGDTYRVEFSVACECPGCCKTFGRFGRMGTSATVSKSDRRTKNLRHLDDTEKPEGETSSESESSEDDSEAQDSEDEDYEPEDVPKSCPVAERRGWKLSERGQLSTRRVSCPRRRYEPD